MLPRIGTSFFALIVVVGALVSSVPAQSDPATQRLANATPRKTALSRPDGTAISPNNPAFREPLVLSAPPRENVELSKQLYEPLAQFLGNAIGRPVVYQYPRSWGVYRTEMVKGRYDLVFDGPHFNSYRAEKLNHNILVRIPVVHEFAVITRPEANVKNISDLAGLPICTHAPPNLGTLVLQSQFPNPVRQPIIRNTKGWDKIYEGVKTNRCKAGVVPIANLKRLDPNGRMTILFRSKPMLNQALSAGPRLSPAEQNRIATALLSPQAAEPTALLRARYKVGPSFVAANNRQYEGLSNYLRNEWGYY